jgi:hypothetical protein
VTRIVGVHGVGNYRSAAPDLAALALAEAWHTPLTASAVDAHLTIAYYADLLRPPGRQGNANDLDPFEEDLFRGWLAEHTPPGGIPAGPVTMPFRQAIGWLSRRNGLREDHLEWFVRVLFKEVAAYLREPDGPARRAVRQRVADAITDSRADVVIAHSLGSVVAYETLWERPELSVDLLVTLGSPLALPKVVLPRLEPGERGRPPGVRRWVNLADPGDLVAVPRRGVGRAFAGVDADEEASIGVFDFHRVKNYLRVDRVANWLLEYGSSGSGSSG